MKKKLNESYTAQENLSGFYSSTIPKGTVLYPTESSKKADSIRHEGTLHWRFVFNSIKGASGHNLPEGNLRIAIWFSKDKFDQKII